MLSFIAPVSLTLKAGAGIHMWDLQLKRLSGLLYVGCQSNSTSYRLSMRLVGQYQYYTL